MKWAQMTCLLMLFVAVGIGLLEPFAVVRSPYVAGWITRTFEIFLCALGILLLILARILL